MKKRKSDYIEISDIKHLPKSFDIYQALNLAVEIGFNSGFAYGTNDHKTTGKNDVILEKRLKTEINKYRDTIHDTSRKSHK